jgi:hypothetical protein
VASTRKPGQRSCPPCSGGRGAATFPELPQKRAQRPDPNGRDEWAYGPREHSDPRRLFSATLRFCFAKLYTPPVKGVYKSRSPSVRAGAS